MIRVGIIDDHQIVINGLSKIFLEEPTMEVVFQTTQGKSVLNTEILSSIDILLLDIEMPEMDGMDLAAAIFQQDPDMKILILSMYNDVAIASRLRDMGVKGFLSKNTDDVTLLKVIKSIDEGNTYFELLRSQSQTTSKGNSKIFYQDKIKALSEREREILVKVVNGLSNQQIGEELFISHRTVDTHRTNLMRKLEVSNVASLVRIALKTGLAV